MLTSMKQRSFFEAEKVRPSRDIRYGCMKCTRNNMFQHKLYGRGEHKILFVGEFCKRAGSKNEPIPDGEHRFINDALQATGKEIKLSDCWYVPAIRCGNVKPKPDVLDFCSHKLLEDIKRLQPRAVVLLGEFAIKAVITNRAKGRLTGIPYTKFYGFQVPDQELKTHIYTTYSISEILRTGEKSGKIDPVVLNQFDKQIESALNAPIFVPSPTPRVRIARNKLDAIQILKDLFFYLIEIFRKVFFIGFFE